jgi:hypothetical protein
VSVISPPRRVALEPKRSTRASGKRATTARVARRAAKRRSSVTIPILLLGLAVLTIGALILANARQMQIGAMQRQLLDAQSSYATSVDSFTRAAAPERIATAAGHMHLVVPQTVIQIHQAPLNVRLAPPRFIGGAAVTSRVVTSSRISIATPAPKRR